MQKVYVALGSNLEPRAQYLAAARQYLRGLNQGSWGESLIYQTPPLGSQDQGAYLNQVVCFDSEYTPHQLLDLLKKAETDLGRQPREHWGAREIDMDLLYVGDQVIASDRTIDNHCLVLPHDQICYRQFVLQPMVDIDPEWKDPGQGMTVLTMLLYLQKKEGKHQYNIWSDQGGIRS